MNHFLGIITLKLHHSCPDRLNTVSRRPSVADSTMMTELVEQQHNSSVVLRSTAASTLGQHHQLRDGGQNGKSWAVLIRNIILVCCRDNILADYVTFSQFKNIDLNSAGSGKCLKFIRQDHCRILTLTSASCYKFLITSDIYTRTTFLRFTWHNAAGSSGSSFKQVNFQHRKVFISGLRGIFQCLDLNLIEQSWWQSVTVECFCDCYKQNFKMGLAMWE